MLCVWILTKPLPSLACTSIIKASNSRKVPKKRFSTHHAACQALFFYSASLHPSKYISARSEANKINRWQPEEVVIFFLEGGGSVLRDAAEKSWLPSGCLEKPGWGCRHQCPFGARHTDPILQSPRASAGWGGSREPELCADPHLCKPPPPPSELPWSPCVPFAHVLQGSCSPEEPRIAPMAPGGDHELPKSTHGAAAGVRCQICCGHTGRGGCRPSTMPQHRAQHPWGRHQASVRLAAAVSRSDTRGGFMKGCGQTSDGDKRP